MAFTPGPHTPAVWDDLLTTTMHNYRSTLTDNVFDSRPGLNFFKEKGRVRYIDAASPSSSPCSSVKVSRGATPSGSS